jgi:ATP-dependent RNA helicase RhlE
LIFWWLLREDFLTLLLRVISLKNLEIFVLDEADRMLDMGFVHDVKESSSFYLKKQTLFFSATMPAEIQKLANSILNNL